MHKTISFFVFALILIGRVPCIWRQFASTTGEERAMVTGSQDSRRLRLWHEHDFRVSRNP